MKERSKTLIARQHRLDRAALNAAADEAAERWPKFVEPPNDIVLMRVAYPPSMTNEQFAASLGMEFRGYVS